MISTQDCNEIQTESERSFGLLVNDVARLLSKTFDRRAQHLGFTRAQWSVIARLHWNQGINQAGLAELMDLEPITLVRLLDRLQDSGWVERRPDPADRRAHRLFLTPQAEPVLVQMRAIAHQVKAEVLAGLSEPDRERLVALLQQVKANLTGMAAGEGPGETAARTVEQGATADA